MEKSNIVRNLLYGVYGVMVVFLMHHILFAKDGSLLLTLALWFMPPVIAALVPIMLLKTLFFKLVVSKNSIKVSGKIALHSTLVSLGLMTGYTIVLALIASVFRMVSPEVIVIFSVPQNHVVVIVELVGLLMLFAWVSYLVEYYLTVAPLSLGVNEAFSVKRSLWYCNILGYLMLTCIFVAWQLMIFYQWPMWLWG